MNSRAKTVSLNAKELSKDSLGHLAPPAGDFTTLIIIIIIMWEVNTGFKYGGNVQIPGSNIQVRSPTRRCQMDRCDKGLGVLACMLLACEDFPFLQVLYWHLL